MFLSFQKKGFSLQESLFMASPYYLNSSGLKRTNFKHRLEDTARYTGLLLAPAKGFDRGFFALRAKKERNMVCWPILGLFWCPVVTLVTGYPSVPNLGTDGHVCPSVAILGTDEQI